MPHYRSSHIRLYLDQTIETPSMQVWFIVGAHFALGLILGVGLAFAGN